MRRLGIGLLLTACSAVGCARQGTPTATTSPGAALAVVETPSGTGSEDGPDGTRPATDPHRPWISTATASDYVLIGDQEQTFGVWVDVPEDIGIPHVPTAVTLAIDTSGSMRGDKIADAREAARRILDSMPDGDRIGVVTFSDQGRILVPPQTLDANSRRRIGDLIEELSADGGTAMHDGLRVAEMQLWETPESHLVRRLVMISDGKATVGPTSPSELGAVAELGLQRGIQVTSIGVGVQYDEHTLNALAIRTSGRLHHVEHSEQLPGIVEREMALLGSTGAAEARIELVAAPGVQLLGTDTSHSQWSGNSLVVPLGTMFEGQRRELLVRARLDTDGREGPRVLASVRLHFRDPSESGLSRVQEAVLRATMTDDPDLVAAHENSRLQTLLAVRDASSMTLAASRNLNDGNLEQADQELAQAQRRLEQQAKRATSAEERKQVAASADRVRRSRKKLKDAAPLPAPARAAATRALSLEANDDAMEADGF